MCADEKDQSDKKEQTKTEENGELFENKTPEDCSREVLKKVNLLFNEFNRAHLLEYVELVNSPKKLFWLNFLSGLAKGLGLTIGTAIVLTILFKLTQHIIALNIPYITVWVSEWIGEVSNLLHAGK